VDEVQTGFGRTGHLFAFQESGVTPDVLIMAKGLASGYPLSAIAAPRRLMERWPKKSHGGTYGGNAVACAAATATVRVLQEEELPQRAATLGRRLTAELHTLQDRCREIVDVRGPGLMVGVEFRGRRGEEEEAPARRVQRACFERGLLLLTCGVEDQVVRWLPPLVVKEEELEAGIRIFAEALAECFDPAGVSP